MISLTLYKQGMKGSWKVLFIFAAILTMYVSIIVSMYDPNLGKALDEFSKSMPELMAAVGMTPGADTMIGFLSAYLYGFILLVFPMVFSILTANRLVARYVERGSMAYLLAAPVNRVKVVFTQLKVLGTGIFALVAYATGVGILTSNMLFPGELPLKEFLFLNLGLLVLQFFIGGICFLASCTFNDTKYSLAFGAGIPALSFIIQMLSDANEDLSFFKYGTFFTLFNPDGIVAGETEAYLGCILLFLGAVILYAGAIVIFNKRDLPL